MECTHTLSLDNRKKLTLTGVTEVESSNELSVKLKTNCGNLSISGNNMAIEQVNIETGEFILIGQIKKLEYKGTSDNNSKFTSLFK